VVDESTMTPSDDFSPVVVSAFSLLQCFDIAGFSDMMGSPVQAPGQ